MSWSSAQAPSGAPSSLPEAPAFAYTAEASQAHDHALQAGGLSALQLMRRAAEAAYATLRRHWPGAETLLVLAGPGHNGGDGAVLAGLAQRRGLHCTVYYLAPPKTETARRAKEFAEAAGVAIAPLAAFDPHGDQILVDALLGTGAAGPSPGPSRSSLSASMRWPCQCWPSIYLAAWQRTRVRPRARCFAPP